MANMQCDITELIEKLSDEARLYLLKRMASRNLSPPASSPGACHRDKQRGCVRLERTRNRMFRLFHSSFNLSPKSPPPMKTFCVSLMSLIAAFLCVPAAHASLSSPDASPSANDYTACRQRDGVKVCPACNGSGKFGNTTCLHCGGKGIVRTNGQRM